MLCLPSFYNTSMLAAYAAGGPARPFIDARFIRRYIYFASFSGALVVLLSVFTLSPWGPDIHKMIGKTSSLLHGPQIVAGSGGSVLSPQPVAPILPAPLAIALPVPLAPQTSAELVVSQAPEIPIDPLDLPGWREDTKWITSTPSVQLRHWLQHLMEGRESDIEWVRNKTILLLGDSVLRGWVYHLCDDFFQGTKQKVEFAEDADVNEKNMGWECVIPTTGTRFINGFVYGMVDYSKYPSDSPLISIDWPVGPWGIEDRIPAIVEQYKVYGVDMIVLNSGAWDMKFMYRRDVFEGRKNDDIDHEELVELSERLRECMRMIRDAWPSSKLAFLQTQPFDTDDTINRWIWARNLTEYGGHNWGVDFTDFLTEKQDEASLSKTLPPMFTRRRVSQLATTYRRIASEEGWDSLDLWKIAEASEPGEFYPKADPVHPSIPTIHIILDFVLEKLWRWETYKV